MRKMYQKSNKKVGFTLIELLVVIAIIGLLSTLAVVALNSARQKARDAKRVADIKQVQTALELFFSENSGYPSFTTSPGNTLGEDIDCGGGTGDACTCLDQNGFQNSTNCGASNAIIYMGLVPANPRPLGPSGASYSYDGMQTGGAAFCTGLPGTVCAEYQIIFTLESAIASLGAGTSCTANQNGVSCQ